MKQFHIEALTSIGLSERAATMYLALLEQGPSTVQEVARSTKLKRAGLYLVMDELLELGFIHKRIMKGHAMLVASSIQSVKSWADKRTASFERALPSLKTVATHRARLPRIEYFSGSDGFRTIWQRLFDSGEKEYLIITDAEHMLGFVRESYIAGPIIQEKKRKHIRSKQLIRYSEYTKAIVAKDAQELRESRFIPHHHPVPTTTLIYGNMVAIIAPLSENLIVLVESASFAETQRSLFYTLWDQLPPITKTTQTKKSPR